MPDYVVVTGQNNEDVFAFVGADSGGVISHDKGLSVKVAGAFVRLGRGDRLSRDADGKLVINAPA